MKTKLLSILIVFFTLTSNAQTYMYGTTSDGGTNNLGTIYRVDENGQNFQKIFDFTTSTGGNPKAGLTLANNKLYGFTTTAGQIINTGASIATGSFFEFDPLTNQVTVIQYFDDKSIYGFEHNNGLMLATNGLLYAASSYGDPLPLGNGIIWSYDPSSSSFNIIASLDRLIDGRLDSKLTEASDGNIYFTTVETNTGGGKIFSLNTSNNTLNELYNSVGFLSNSQNSEFDGAINNALFEASNGFLYGCSKLGGNFNEGLLFKIDKNGNNFTKLHVFSSDLDLEGFYPTGGFIEKNGFLYSSTSEGKILNSDQGTFYKVQLSNDAITFTNILDFEGVRPTGTFTESPNGRFYITCSGGNQNGGSIVEFKPSTEDITQRHLFSSNTNGIKPLRNELCVVDFSVLSIDETSLIDDFVKSYPNPVQDIINIKITGSDKIETIKILDLKGSELYIDESKTKESVINTSFLSSGVYLLYIETNTGSTTRKIIKE